MPRINPIICSSPRSSCRRSSARTRIAPCTPSAGEPDKSCESAGRSAGNESGQSDWAMDDRANACVEGDTWGSETEVPAPFNSGGLTAPVRILRSGSARPCSKTCRICSLFCTQRLHINSSNQTVAPGTDTLIQHRTDKFREYRTPVHLDIPLKDDARRVRSRPFVSLSRRRSLQAKLI